MSVNFLRRLRFSSDGFNPSETDAPSRGVIRAMRGLCATALLFSGYLAWTALNASEVYGCGGDVFDCGHVLTSSYSRWFGIPVSIPAVALYASLLVVLGFAGKTTPHELRRYSWIMLQVGGTTAGLAALWFVGLQVFVIKHFCVYCLGAHTCGLMLAASVWWVSPSRIQPVFRTCAVAGLGLCLLIAGQFLSPEQKTFIVEHFPDAQDVESVANGDQAADEGLFEAPGDVFDAPSDVFEAPGEVYSAPDEIFAAPGADVFAPPVESNTDTRTKGASEAVAVPDKPVKSTGTEIEPVNESENSISPAEKPPAASSTALPAPSAETGRVVLNPDGVSTTSPPQIDVAKPRVAAGLLLFFAPKASSGSLLRLFHASCLTPDESLPADEAKSTERIAEKRAGQSDVPEKTTAEQDPNADAAEAVTPAAPEPRIVSAAGGKFRLNAAQWPILGKPTARYIFVEMFDYTCPHCRNTHRTIKDAFRKYGDDLAVIALAVPLNPACNKMATTSSTQNIDACELARISVGVWRVAPDRFMEFHNWMFDGGRNRTASEARRYADSLVGAEALKKELSQKTAAEYISRHVELYRKVGSGSVPKLLFPKSAMTGEVGSVNALVQSIEREFAE